MTFDRAAFAVFNASVRLSRREYTYLTKCERCGDWKPLVQTARWPEGPYGTLPGLRTGPSVREEPGRVRRTPSAGRAPARLRLTVTATQVYTPRYYSPGRHGHYD